MNQTSTKSPQAKATSSPPAPAKSAEPAFVPMETTSSRQFTSWLNEQRASLAFTTYQANFLVFIGRHAEGKLVHHRRGLTRCMGMVAHGGSLYVSALYQIWRFENALAKGQSHDGHDRLYVPKLSHVTGDLDVHDMAIDRDGRLVFVNTLFGCLATTSERHSFVPLYRPPFISKLAAEDRCHLNGLAMKDGRPAYLTAVSEGDVVDDWRDHRHDGGVVIDIAKNEVVVRGLSMPHSPRWYRNKLWLHDSGTGEFGYADLKSGRFEPVTFCPGYLRGLDFIADFAVVGLSEPRGEKAFTGLPLNERLEAKKAKARCAIQVIDLRTGDVVHWVRFESLVHEFYDVAVLRDCRQPMAIGFQSDEIRRAITIGGAEERSLQMLAPEPPSSDSKTAA